MPVKTKMLDYGGFVHSPERRCRRISPNTCGRSICWWRHGGARSRSGTNRGSRPICCNARRRRNGRSTSLRRPIRTSTRSNTSSAIRRSCRWRGSSRVSPDPPAVCHPALQSGPAAAHGLRVRERRRCCAANAALGQVTPLRWWQNGPSNHPCYLFGEWIWELKPTELNSSDKGLTLLFETTRKRTCCNAIGCGTTFPAPAARPRRAVHSGAVRAGVWRRDGGKCVRCGSREGIDFSIVGPAPTAIRKRYRTCNCFARDAAGSEQKIETRR